MVGQTDDVAGVLEELRTAAGRADPYSRYAVLREHAPAFHSPQGVVVVGRYDDCQWILRDERFGKGTAHPWDHYGMTESAWHDRFPASVRHRRALLFLDPPDHTRVRRLVAKAFTPRTVERLRPDIVRLADQVLERLDGTVDVIAELALTLPIGVIGEMLGVPEADRMDLQPLVRATTATLEFRPPLAELDAAEAARVGLVERLEDLIEARRAKPTDDLLSGLIHVQDEGDQLGYNELVAMVNQLFSAGFETTTNLIGNGLLALLDHPDQLARLRADRSLLRPAIEEMLRWDSPVQADGRTAFVDIDLHGVEVPAGDRVVMLLGAANRDPRAFPDAERFDVGRDGSPPLSFGAGIHHCLGAALARTQGQVVFDRLLECFATIEPAWPDDERPVHHDRFVLRGLQSLPVHLG